MEQVLKDYADALVQRERAFLHAGAQNRDFGGIADLVRFGLPHRLPLAAEALDHAWQEMATQRARAQDLEQLLTGYLSRAARNAPGRNCPAAALGGDVSRQSDDVRTVFAEGLEQMIASVAALLPDPGTPDTRARAVDLVNRMVGALMLSRAVPDDSALAEEILQTALQSALADARTRRTAPESGG